jgi:hypothetical protein
MSLEPVEEASEEFVCVRSLSILQRGCKFTLYVLEYFILIGFWVWLSKNNFTFEVLKGFPFHNQNYCVNWLLGVIIFVFCLYFIYCSNLFIYITVLLCMCVVGLDSTCGNFLLKNSLNPLLFLLILLLLLLLFWWVSYFY